MQAENDNDLDGGQRSSEVKWGKLCAMATIFSTYSLEIHSLTPSSFIICL